MGNSESTSSTPAEGGTSIDDFDGIETLGYRVLGVQPNSPASAAGLVSFFDFLIGADNQMLLGSGEDLQEGDEYDDVDFPALLETFKGRPLQLLVWNIKCQEQRLVDITPSDNWEGAGLLGVTIRLDNYAGAEDRLIRILSVEVNSPAAIAGLVSSQDYLLGTTTHSFDSTKVLAAVLEANVDKVVELYVYNTNSDKVRVVALMPTWSWGGNGLLGAEVGTGYLHRLPGSCRNTLGGSVERRVRWINKTGPTSPAAALANNNNNNSNNAANNTQAQQQQQQSGVNNNPSLQQATTLELEPQLEMEPNHEEEEEEEQLHHTQQVTTHEQVAPAPIPYQQQEQQQTQQQQQPLPVTPAKPASAPNLTTTTPSPTVIPATTPDKPAISVFDPTATAPPITPARTPSAFSHASPPVSGGVPVPAPYPLSPGTGILPADPAAQPITITTFIPGAKPPPDVKNVSAEDLFSGPPPVAKIPTKNTLTISSSSVGSSSVSSPTPPERTSSGISSARGVVVADGFNKSPSQTRSMMTTPQTSTSTTTTNGTTGSSALPNGSSPYFSTPHPPSQQQQTTTQQTPQYDGPPPPVLPAAATGAYGTTNSIINDILPPPPKMSGAQ